MEQQASLFPAAISDDSPWKQANATSVLDPETENKTQEAINMYFSQNHQVRARKLVFQRNPYQNRTVFLCSDREP